MPTKPKVTSKAAPRTSQPKKPPAKRPPPQANSRATVSGSNMLSAGGFANLGTGLLGAYTANKALDMLKDNPMLLYAAAGVAVLVLLR